MDTSTHRVVGEEINVFTKTLWEPSCPVVRASGKPLISKVKEVNILNRIS